MHPTLCSIGSFTVYSYGVMVAIGFALATFFISREADAFGLDHNRVIDITILALLAGIAGARLFYVALNLGYYRQHLLEIVNLTRGGLVWYGGFFSGFLALIVYTRVARIDPWQVLDLVAPYIALAQAFGRIGCFLNGCCYGTATGDGYPFGIVFPGDVIARHPAQLYEAAALFALFLALRLTRMRRHVIGGTFLLYCMSYALIRFMIEFVRGDNPHILLGLTISQCISIVILFAAGSFYILKAAAWKRNVSASK